MMMDALMYGWIDRANRVALENAEPDMTLNSPRIEFCISGVRNQSVIVLVLTKGTGTTLPSL